MDDLKARVMDALRPEIREFATHVDPENEKYSLIIYRQEEFLSTLADKVIEAIREPESGPAARSIGPGVINLEFTGDA